MKKSLISLFVISLFLKSFVVSADEGMWLPQLLSKLNYGDMKSKGLNLTAEQVYSINNTSIKDAVVSINGGDCTGQIISADGLMITCYHCIRGYIQEHSSIQNDYITTGFWAKTKKEEKRNDKLRVSFLVNVENVTAKITSNLNDKISIEDRNDKIKEISDQLINQATKGTHYNASVESFYNGNEFYLFTYETFTDVRLVGAPPSQIARFGGDTDNWTWPRFRADFGLLRVYSAPNGKPASYKRTNVPYHSKHFFPISIKGIKENDFSMIMGYPGNTNRYITSFGVNMEKKYINPLYINIRGKKLELMDKQMKSNEEINIQYFSKYYKTSNYWKYFIGQNEMIDKLDIIKKKEEIEKEFFRWAMNNNEGNTSYKQILPMLKDSYEKLALVKRALIYYNEALLGGGEIINYSKNFMSLANDLELNLDQEQSFVKSKKLLYAAKKYFKNYNVETDKIITTALLEMFEKDIEKSYHPEAFSVIEKKYKGNISEYVNDIFKKSIFANSDKVLNALSDPNYKIFEKDPAFQLMKSIIKKHKEINKEYRLLTTELDNQKRIFAKGLLKMQNKEKVYPDANKTMRLSYGNICNYKTANNTYHKFYTDINGIFKKEKDNPTIPDFNTPDRFRKMYEAKDYGKYAENGVLKTCFLANNDITGGNSGSAVLDANGHLVGIAFDINWEATSVAIAFDSELQRCINTDIRYILWIIDKFAGATNLIDEMKIIE